MAGQPAPLKGIDHVRAVGDTIADQGIVSVKSPKATLVIGAGDAESYRITAEVKLVDKATSTALQVMPDDLLTVAKRAALYASFYRDAPGLNLVPDGVFLGRQEERLGQQETTCRGLNYWPAPTQKDRLEMLKGIEPAQPQGPLACGCASRRIAAMCVSGSTACSWPRSIARSARRGRRPCTSTRGSTAQRQVDSAPRIGVSPRGPDDVRA